MRHRFLFLLVCLAVAFPPQVRGQSGCVINGVDWCAQKVDLQANEFPLLGMTFGGLGKNNENNRFKRWGLNGFYNPNGREYMQHGIGQYLRNGMKTYDRFAELKYGNPSGDFDSVIWIAGWMKGDESHLSEKRFFLASNEDAIPDSNERFMYNHETLHNWKEVAPIRRSNLEAVFSKDSLALDSTGYLLRTLDGNVGIDVKKWNLGRTVWAGSDSAYCDFIYRIDTTELQSIGLLDSLFVVEFSVTLADSTSGGVSVNDGAVVITKDSYIKYLHQGAGTKKEHTRVLEFPLPLVRNSGTSPRSYAVIRWTLPLHGFPHPVVGIDCRVKRIGDASLYVRGLRVRSRLADKLLKEDSAVVAHIKWLCDSRVQMLKNSTFEGVRAWDNVLGFSVGNEARSISYRCFAAIDKLVFEYTGKRIQGFFSNNLGAHGERFEVYRTIYEDQNGIPPPEFGAENLELFSPADFPGSAGHAFPYPDDAIDYRLRSRADFIRERTPIVGQDLLPNTSAVTSYADYLWTVQGKLNRFSFAEAARMAYPAFNRRTDETGYLAHLSTITTVNHPEKGQTAAPLWLRDTMLKRVMRGDCSPFDTTLTSTSLGLSSEAFAITYRSPLSTELRAQAWDALTYGARGFIFNTVTSDGGNNIGMTSLASWDSTFSVDYDIDTTDGAIPMVANIELGTWADPFLGPQTSWDELGRFTHHVIRGSSCPSDIDANRHRLIPIFSDRSFTIHDSTYPLHTYLDGPLFYDSARMIYRSRIQDYVRYHTDTLHSVYFEDTPLCWVPSMEGVWRAYGDTTMNRLCLIWGDGWEPFRFAYKRFHAFPIWAPLYYGFAEKQRGALRVVEDVKPIARTIRKLSWQAGFGLNNLNKVANIHHGEYDAKLDSLLKRDTRSGLQLLPLRDLSSQHVLPFAFDAKTQERWTLKSGAFDHEDSSYYNIGIYEDTTDRKTKYLVIANRRTWPVYFRDSVGVQVIKMWDSTVPSAPQALKGAIDVRAFRFRVDRTKLDSSYTYFTIANLRSGDERTLHVDSAYTLYLEPGEGTLLRVGPARSFVAARTSKGGMEYNNGHRVADLGTITSGQTTFTQRMMTWEREGNIQYALVNNAGLVTEENFLNPSNLIGAPNAPISSHTLDTSGRGYNPSIAAKRPRDAQSNTDTIAVIWSRTAANGLTRDIKVAVGVRDVSGSLASIDWLMDYNGGQPVTIATVPVVRTEDYPTPTVTPTYDGFFCSWAGYNDASLPRIRTAFLHFADMSGSFRIEVRENAPLVANGSPVKALFPSVASRNEFADLSGRKKSRVHLAWEEQLLIDGKSSSHIYYAWFERSFSGINGPWVDESLEPHENNGSGIERVSKGYSSCVHHYPHVAVQNRWATIGNSRIPIFGGPTITWETVVCAETNEGSVLLRSRLGPEDPAPWPPVTWGSFTEFGRRTNNIFQQPHVRIGQDGVQGPNMEARAVIFQHVNDVQLTIERQPRQGEWQRSTMYERGQHPSVTLPYSAEPVQGLSTWTFRGDLADESGLYSARITARREGNAKSESKNLANTYTVTKTEYCNRSVAFVAGTGSIGCETCPEDPNDTTATPRRPIRWLEKDIAFDGLGAGDERGNSTLGYTSGTQYPWLETEDTLRSAYFEVNSNDVLRLDHSFVVEDSSGLVSNFPDTNRYIRFELLLKDSASNQVLSVLELNEVKLQSPSPAPPELVIRSGFPSGSTAVKLGCLKSARGMTTLKDLPPGWVVSPPPSGKAYLTVRATKDTLSDFELAHTQTPYTDYAQVIGETEEFTAPAPKKAQKSGRGEGTVQLSIIPNPLSTACEITLQAVSEMPTVIELYDVAGQKISSLYEGLAPESGTVQLNFDRRQLSDGTYFVRAVCGSEVVTRRMVVLK